MAATGKRFHNWEAAKYEAKEILSEVARNEGTIEYGQLAGRLTAVSLGPRNLDDLLEDISIEEHAEGRGMLSAVVVLKAEHRPGVGFFRLARQLGHDLSFSDMGKDEFWSAEVRKVHIYWSKKIR